MSIQPSNDIARAREQDSLGAARAGSDAALGQLFDFYRDYLLRIANDELPNDLRGKIGASDVVQETFLQATRAFERFHGQTDAELKAWLRKILINNVLDARKLFAAQRRSAALEVHIDDGPDGARHAASIPCRGPRPSAAVVSAETRAAVENALQRLPQAHRRVIELRSFEGRSFEEAGAALGRSTDAARRLWSRAVQLLSVELSRE